MTTYPLSSGTDSVTGSAGDDLIVGNAADWQAADTIAAGSGNDTLQVTALAAAQAVVTDALFAHITGLETLDLRGKFAETVTLGALSDDAGLVSIDGSQLAGNLTVDASARIGGITIETAKGVNTLIGSVDSDTFRFTSAGFSATDTVDGGGNGDADTIVITDKASVADTAFAKVSHMEVLALGAGAIDHTGQKVTLGKLSVAAGIAEVDVLNAQGATLDATARTLGLTVVGNKGDDVFKASQGNDVFHGGFGDDSYQVKAAQLTLMDQIDGEGGRDEIRIMDSGTPLFDVDFANVLNTETLAFNSTAAQTVTLGSFANGSGLDTIEASKLTAGLDLTLTAGFKQSLEIKLGTGADSVDLSAAGAGSHIVTMKSTSLTKADTLIGRTGGTDVLQFSDAVKLTDKFFAGATGVDNVAALWLDNPGKGQSLVAGDAFKTFVANAGLTFVLALGDSKDSSITYDFSTYTGNQLIVGGTGGSDLFIASAVDMIFSGAGSTYDQGGADTFRFKSAWYNSTDVVNGGKSTADVLAISDSTAAIIDADFTNTKGVEQLRLEATAGSTYSVTLGSAFDASGIEIIDAGKAGVSAGVNAAATMNGHVFVAGTKADALTGGSGADTFQFTTANLTSQDFVTGGTSGGGGDTLQFTTAGAIKAAALQNVAGIEIYQLSQKGNAIALTDQLVATGESIQHAANGTSIMGNAFVLTGAGKDTVDLSQLSTFAGSALVIGSGGGDSYIGSAKADTFIFQKASDLAVGTQIDGGAGSDGLLLAAGTYTAAQFKGMKHIDGILLSDADPAATFKITLGNEIFASSDSHALNVLPMVTLTGDLTLDASAVTDPLASLLVLASGGDVTLKGTPGDDAISFTGNNTGGFSLNTKDVVAGGAGMDTIVLSTNYNGTAVFSSGALAHVTGVERMVVVSGSATDFDWILNFQAQAAGINDVNGFPSQGKLTLDAGSYTTAITIHAGQNDDVITTGIGNDTIAFDKISSNAAILTANDQVDGGAGIDRLLFTGGATLADAAFTNVSHVERIALEDGSYTITLGSHSDQAGIAAVDGSKAGSTVVVFGSASTAGLDLVGSNQIDLLQGGSGADRIEGGAGGDALYGKGGNDHFIYRSATDSRQLANDITHMDVIADFAAGDVIEIGALAQGAISVFNHGTMGSFITTDTSGWFGSNDVATAYDGTNTRVYIDANHDGDFNLGQDVVIQLVGNHIVDASNAAAYA
jgi:Ca2+-binding RTX toxin-like protein